MKKRYTAVKDKAIIMGIGVLIGTAVTLICMLIFALIISLFSVDRAFAVPMATVCAAIGCFAAAFFSSKKIGEKGYIIGTLIGTAVFVLVTVISMLISNANFTNNTLFHLLIMVISSILGGIFGVHKTNKKLI